MLKLRDEIYIKIKVQDAMSQNKSIRTKYGKKKKSIGTLKWVLPKKFIFMWNNHIIEEENDKKRCR